MRTSTFVLAIPWYDKVWDGKQGSYLTELREQEGVFTQVIDMKRYETRDDHNRRMPTCLIHNMSGNDIAYLATTRSSKEHYPNKSELHWYANDDYPPPFCLATVKAVTEGIKRSLGPEKTPQLDMPLQAASHINFLDDLMVTLDDDDLNHIHEVTESAFDGPRGQSS